MKKIIVFSALIILSITLWLANLEYPNPYLEKGFYTLLTLTVIYSLFKVILEWAVNREITDSKVRYHLKKKAVSIIHILVIVIAVITIWVENPQALLVAYGIIAAGIAVALQDVFKNLAGGITIFLTGIYRGGDRVEINPKYGDVIDTGMFYTTLLDLREWVSGDQSTGRVIITPNGYVLSGNAINYTQDNDYKGAVNKILDIVRRETWDITKEAKKEILRIEGKYYLPQGTMEPAIFLTMTDNRITFNIRYMVKVRERGALHNRLTQILPDGIQRSENIRISPETMHVSLRRG